MDVNGPNSPKHSPKTKKSENLCEKIFTNSSCAGAEIQHRERICPFKCPSGTYSWTSLFDFVSKTLSFPSAPHTESRPRSSENAAWLHGAMLQLFRSAGSRFSASAVHWTTKPPLEVSESVPLDGCVRCVRAVRKLGKVQFSRTTCSVSLVYDNSIAGRGR